MQDEYIRQLLSRYIEIEQSSNPSVYIKQIPTPKQREFLDLDCYEAFYGGAAGGGKSSCLLMDAFKYVNHPEYSALLLRRTYAELALPGAIMSRAKEWIADTPAQWHDSSKTIHFPTGATVTFGYLENDNDVYRYQGAEFHYIGIDELPQLPEFPYRYLMSRTRRQKESPIPIRMRGTGNPGGIGHDWVKARFIDGQDETRRFIPALIEDNPHLDAEDYRQRLSNLDEITRLQLEKGVWIRNTEGMVYKYDDVRNGIDYLPPKFDWHYVIGVDLGASQSKPTTAFALLAYAYNHPNAYVVQSEVHAGMIPSTIAQRIKEYQADYKIVSVIMDEGALGKGYAEEMRQRHCLNIKPAEKQNKLGFRQLINGEYERAKLFVVRPSNTQLTLEMHNLVWDAKGLDNEKGLNNHLTDAMLYAWREVKNWLAKEDKPEPKPTDPEYGRHLTRKFEKQLMRRQKQPFYRRMGM